MPNLSNQLLELMQVSARELIQIYHHKGKNTQTQLIIPEYRGTNNLRISEQELRFVMTGLIPRVCPGINFSIETPTDKPYGTGRSASTDLTLYNNNNLNIELKAHNPELKAINKDIEKLCQENVEGAWCHIFENAKKSRTQNREGTVETLFTKFATSITEHFQLRITPPIPFISFHILILEKRTLLSRKGSLNDWDQFDQIHQQGDNDLSKEWLMQNIFNIEYDDWDQASSGDAINKWQIQKY